jgi:hypothetical protein
MNMMTVGGNPFQIARPFGARRARLRGWLTLGSAMLAAAILAVGMSSSAWAGAGPSGPLAAQVWVANGGAFNAGSMVTFAAGSSKNAKPLYFNVGKASLLQNFPGSPFLATGPAGVALTPDGQHVTVAGELVAIPGTDIQGAVMTYTPTANGDVAPEDVIFGGDIPEFSTGTELSAPTGVVYGPIPFFYDAQQSAQQIMLGSSELYVTNQLSAAFALPSITEYPEGSGNLGGVPFAIGFPVSLASTDVEPDEVIYGAAEPIGIYVDTAYMTYCIPGVESAPTTDPTTLCNTGIAYETYTRRIWVVDRYLGAVLVFVPEFECNLGLNADACHGNGDLPPGHIALNPIGGIFPTTNDGVFPPASSDPTEPNYLAVGGVNSLTPDLYITDLAGGYHHKGRIKFFYTNLVDECIDRDTFGDCILALRGVVQGTYDGAISGSHTKLGKPMGIAAAPTGVAVSSNQSSAATDNIFVTNIDRNNIVQFSSGERGNIRPDAYIQGKKTKLLQPTGIAVVPTLNLRANQQP